MSKIGKPGVKKVFSQNRGRKSATTTKGGKSTKPVHRLNTKNKTGLY